MTDNMWQESLESALAEHLTGASDPLLEICRYTMQGGQRSRAALLLGAAGETSGRALPAAAAVEMIHAATLLQDDVFDAGHVRRGRPAAHLAFGKASAILASDWLLIRSLELASEVHPLFFRELSRAARAMVQAESCELTSPAPHTMEEAHRLCCHIACGKTAGLFGACLYGAAVLQNLPPAQQATWREAGVDMGITYQMVDDCVDCYCDESVSGKTAGGDFRAGRLTLPVLCSIAALGEAQKAEVLHAFHYGQLEPALVLELQGALQSTGVRSHLLTLLHGRLATHPQQAHRAGINMSVVNAWTLKLLKQVAVISA